MTPRAATRLAWGMWTVAFAEAASAVVLFLLSVGVPAEVYGYRGGSLETRSSPGGGTTVSGRVPTETA